jgi:hypothetical protein
MIFDNPLKLRRRPADGGNGDTGSDEVVLIEAPDISGDLDEIDRALGEAELLSKLPSSRNCGCL